MIHMHMKNGCGSGWPAPIPTMTSASFSYIATSLYPSRSSASEAAQVEELTSRIDKVEESELEAVHDLGKRLFFDPAGPTPMYGIRPAALTKTSWNGLAVDPDDPAKLVEKLEASHYGCLWLKARWSDLSAQLEPGKFWQSHDRLKAIRLLGHQPADALEVRTIAEIFVASHTLNPVGHGLFDDLLSDVGGTTSLGVYRMAVKARWPELVSADDPVKCRQLLIDLVDENIERLDAKLAEHEANADVHAQRAFARLGYDNSADGHRIRQHQMRCVNALYRGMETYRKYQGKKKAEGGGPRAEDTWGRRPGRAEGGGRRAEDTWGRTEGGGRRTEEGRPTIGDAGRWAEAARGTAGAAWGRAEDGGRRTEVGGPHIDDGLDWAREANPWGQVFDGSSVAGAGERAAFDQPIDSNALPDRGAQPGCGSEAASLDQSASATMMADTTLTDDATLAGATTAFATVTLSDGITLPATSELDSTVADAGGDSPEVSDANAIADCGDGISPRGENGENDTNEPTVDEVDGRAIITQNEDPVEVAANSPVDAGLDKPADQAGTAEGPEQGLIQKPHHSNAGVRDPDRADPLAGMTQSELHQRRWLMWEAKKREEERRRQERLNARDGPPGESITDIGATPPPMAAQAQQQQLPRSP